ncbi:hypothetical protein MHI22_18020 [Lysinibacillus sp. FSL L8-0312]|uniref:hypothetical protein n=1 Tax=Lysinibacillus sp. FSL L8-0312 TaxID=2921521 RepID=UPI0030FC16AB
MTKTKNERITTLENEVAELKLIVHELRGKKSIEPSTTNTVEDIIEFEGQQYRKVDRVAREGDVVISSAMTSFLVEKGKPYKVSCFGRDLVLNKETSKIVALYNVGRTPETVDVYELIKPKPLTPNQQRAVIVEKAKKFLKEGLRRNYKNTQGFDPSVWLVSENGAFSITHKVEFIVNEEKRSVVALIKLIKNSKVHRKGITKCAPNDVFNEHIGKAIALGRALDLDVAEFEQAVQPTEFVSGQIITYTSELAGQDRGGNFEISYIEDDTLWFHDEEGYDLFGDDWKPKIINDNNANYEEG